MYANNTATNLKQNSENQSKLGCKQKLSTFWDKNRQSNDSGDCYRATNKNTRRLEPWLNTGILELDFFQD